MVSIAMAAKSHGQCRQATSTDLVVGCCHIFPLHACTVHPIQISTEKLLYMRVPTGSLNSDNII